MSERTTLHLTPKDVWERQSGDDEYLPEAYATEGFIHCTDGDEQMLHVANLFYCVDPRPFVVLTINVERLKSEVRYEDADRIYPHIYGPLNKNAIVGLRTVERSSDGAFIRFHD